MNNIRHICTRIDGQNARAYHFSFFKGEQHYPVIIHRKEINGIKSPCNRFKLYNACKKFPHLLLLIKIVLSCRYPTTLFELYHIENHKQHFQFLYKFDNKYFFLIYFIIEKFTMHYLRSTNLKKKWTRKLLSTKYSMIYCN